MPNFGYIGETLDDVSITGTDIRDVSMTVQLQRESEIIPGTDVIYKSAMEVTCDFDLTGASVGTWDVYLKHNDDGQSSTLDDAFFVHWPAISVSKTASTNGVCPGTDPLAVSIGDTVTYCFDVTNTGDVTLTGVTVNDDIYGSVTLGTTTLAPGETTEGTLTHIVTESDVPSVTNIATVNATDLDNNRVSDTDDCTIKRRAVSLFHSNSGLWDGFARRHQCFT